MNDTPCPSQPTGTMKMIPPTGGNSNNPRDSMSLPTGCTCEDCRMFDACKQFGVILGPGQTRCDWSPSKFAFSAKKAIEYKTLLREAMAVLHQNNIGANTVTDIAKALSESIATRLLQLAENHSVCSDKQ